MRAYRTAAVAVLLAAAACARTETLEQMQSRVEAESDSARAAIEPIAQAYARYFAAGQADSIAAIYHEIAYVMPPNMASVRGGAAVREMMAGYFAAGAAGNLVFHIQNVTANGPIAVVRGHWVYTPPAGGRMPADSGYYMEHWARNNGTWQIAEDIWNSSAPLPPAPPARRR